MLAKSVVWRLATLAILTALALTLRAAAGENLVANSSAEKASGSGVPAGWGLYVGAGKMKLAASDDHPHSGGQSACLEFTRWHLAKDAADQPENRQASGAIVLAANNGYRPQGAIPCRPGTTYAFSFWYRGDVPSARVSVTCWPSADAESERRASAPVTAAALRPGPEWQRATGTFRMPEAMGCFALMIAASGRESEGFRLGKLYVDDAQIVAKEYPDGELRAVWCGLPKAVDREEGMREIAETVAKTRAAGFNTLFVLTSSLYVASLDRPELPEPDPLAAWDALGETIRAAKSQGLQVHAWYSPWHGKSQKRAVELREHPDWSAVSAQGVADKGGVCLARPEVRQFELDLLARLVDRYPDLAGLHIEEPGYNWGADYCYCDHCARLSREWFGIDARRDPAAARPTLHNLAAFMCTDFFARLRALVTARRPELWLSANGSSGRNPDWTIGRDWTTWARRGYIDFYVPQVYTRSPEVFTKKALETKSCLGECDLVTGMAVSWSSIYPERQDPQVIVAEIAAARKLGAKGFCVFHRTHFLDEHFAAVREAIDAKP